MTESEFKVLLDQRLSDLADVLLLYYRPCELTEGRCRLGRLLGGPAVPCCHSHAAFQSHPEEPCPLLGEHGCTVKLAKCKLWFCQTVLEQADPRCVEAMRILESLLRLFELGSRPYLGQGYVGRRAELAALRAEGD